MARYPPNVPGALVHLEVLAPPDLARIFGLAGGSIFQGQQGLDQMAFMRRRRWSLNTLRPWTGSTRAARELIRVEA